MVFLKKRPSLVFMTFLFGALVLPVDGFSANRRGAPVQNKKELAKILETMEGQIRALKMQLDAVPTETRDVSVQTPAPVKSRWTSCLDVVRLRIRQKLTNATASFVHLSDNKEAALQAHTQTAQLFFEAAWENLGQTLLVLSVGFWPVFLYQSFLFVRKPLLKSAGFLSKRSFRPETVMTAFGFFLFVYLYIFYSGLFLLWDLYAHTVPMLAFGQNLAFVVLALWGSALYVRFVFNPRKPQEALVCLEEQKARLVSFWIKSGVKLTLLWELARRQACGGPEMLFFETVSDLLLTAMTWTVFLIVQELQIKRSKSARKSFSSFWVFFVKGSALACWVSWMFERSFFENIFYTSVTLAVLLPTTDIAYACLRKGRIVFLRQTFGRNDGVARLVRARSFNLWMRRALQSLVFGASVYAWDLNLLLRAEDMFWAQQTNFLDPFIGIALIVLSAFVLIRTSTALLRYFLESRKPNDAIERAHFLSRSKTIYRVANAGLKILVIVPSIFAALNLLQFDTKPLVTSLGFLTVGLALGSQTFIRDFMTGFFVIFENSLTVGDDVEIEGQRGKVEDLTLRIVRIRREDGTLVTFALSSIARIGNKSRFFAYAVFNISVHPKEDSERIRTVMERAILKMKRSDIGHLILAPLEYKGVLDITEYAMVLGARLRTAPGEQDTVLYAYTRILKTFFDEEGIRIPAPPGNSACPRPSMTRTPIVS